MDLHVWNASHSARWNRLRTALRREVPGLEYFRGVEVQDGKRGGTSRGALHDHALVWSPVPLDVRDLRALAIRAGFGHSTDLAACPPGSKRHAYYVSKYVSKSTDSRAEVPWVDLVTGEVVPGRYRTWSMSRSWGDTMATVRARGAAYARVRAAERDDGLLVGLLVALGGTVVSMTAAGPEPAD